MTTFKMLPTTADMAMIRAGAKAAREYLLETGRNNPAVIYEAMVATALEQPSHAEFDKVAIRNVDIENVASIMDKDADELENDHAYSGEVEAVRKYAELVRSLKPQPSQPNISPLLAN